MRHSSSLRCLLLQVPMLLLLPLVAECKGRTPRSFSLPPHSSLILNTRGGSTTTGIPTDKPSSASDKYRMQQVVLLQARSARLREALMERGVLKNVANSDAAATPQPVDWDCALATPRNPRRCLYAYEPQLYTKVVAPIDTDEWISLSQLNRLRRTEPKKIEPLWHNKFAITASWFKPSAPYSMYAHLPWQGYLLTILLDVPWVLNATVMMALLTALHLTRTIWEPFFSLLLTSTFMWNRWPFWYRYAHAALPFKMLIGQMAWKGLAKVFAKVEGIAREYLITVESKIWESAIPVTVIEPGDEDLVDSISVGGSGAGGVDEEEEDDEDDNGGDEEGMGDDEEEVVNFDDEDADEEDTGFEMITTFGGVERRYTF